MKNKIKLKIQIDFLNDISILLDSGCSFNEALEYEKDFLGNSNFHIDLIEKEITKGKTFSGILKAMDFDSLIVTYLSFVEIKGDLNNGIKQITKLIEQKQKIEKEVQRKINQPIILLSISLLMVVIITSALLPQFEQIYFSMNVEMSGISLYVFTFLKLVPKAIAAIILGAVLCWIYVWVYKCNRNKVKVFEYLLNFPVISKILKIYISLKFAIYFQILKEGNDSLFEVLMNIRKQENDLFLNKVAYDLEKELLEGEKLTGAIKSLKYFDYSLVLPFEKGLITGEYSNHIDVYINIMMTKIKSQILKLVIGFQITVYIFISIFIVLIYISMLMPLLQMMAQI